MVHSPASPHLHKDLCERCALLPPPLEHALLAAELLAGEQQLHLVVLAAQEAAEQGAPLRQLLLEAAQKRKLAVLKRTKWQSTKSESGEGGPTVAS